MMRSGVFAIPDFSQLESESGYYSSRSPDRNCGPGSHRDPVTATDWLAGCSNRDPAIDGGLRHADSEVYPRPGQRRRKGHPGGGPG